VGRARAALPWPHRCPAQACWVRANPHYPLPVRSLSLATPAWEWLLPMAHAAAPPVRHASRIASALVRVAPRLVAVATPDRPAAEPPRPSELSLRALPCGGQPGGWPPAGAGLRLANAPTRSPPAHVSPVSGPRAPTAAGAGARYQRLRSRHYGTIVTDLVYSLPAGRCGSEVS